MNHVEYDSFGNLISETDTSVDVGFGFNGKWVDAETGYTHHLNRWFDPVVGNWISESMVDKYTPEQEFLETCEVNGDVEIDMYHGERGPVVTLYGDPSGLRSLASILVTLADLDQQVVPARNLPVGEGFHLHLFESRGLNEGSLALDLGRMDRRNAESKSNDKSTPDGDQIERESTED